MRKLLILKEKVNNLVLIKFILKTKLKLLNKSIELAIKKGFFLNEEFF